MTAPADPALDLSRRTGLPDDLAYLRAGYPQPGWRAHPSYGDLAAFWLQVHAGLRREGADVVTVLAALRDRRIDARGFQQAFVPRLNQFLQHLNQHHQIEDAAYFPKFRALDPRMVAGFDLLEADHELIHARLDATIASARALLAALAGPDDAQRRALEVQMADTTDLVRLLGQHLGDEEEIVIPALLEHGEAPLR